MTKYLQSKFQYKYMRCSAICTILLINISAGAQTIELNVDAKSNIFYSGTNLTPPTLHCAIRAGASNNGLGDGLYPPHISLNPGLRSIQLSAKNTANISYAAGYPAAPTPDGIATSNQSQTTSTNPSGTMPGLKFAGRIGMLAAVLLDDSIINGSGNISIHTFDSTSMNAPAMAFGLRDTFYIGDGTVVDWPTTGGLPNGTQQRQNISIPTGATKLFFGLTDAYAINGPNQCYMDNVGGIIVTLNMTISDDSGVVAEGIGGVAIKDVKENDYTSTKSNNVNVKPISPPIGSSEGMAWIPGITLNPDGSVVVASTVAQGEYKAWYELCDSSTNPESCSQALVTVGVVPQPLKSIGAQPDSGQVVFGVGGTAILNIRGNDNLDNNTATVANTTLHSQGVWPSGISLDSSTGNIIVDSTTPVGTYNNNYKICEINRPTNCAVTNVTITVITAGAVNSAKTVSVPVNSLWLLSLLSAALAGLSFIKRKS